jgi:uncharacterized protein YndB with AHSA1/START domain
MNSSLGHVTKEADGFKVRFERIFHHDIDTVWDAITNPEKLKYWFTDIEMDFRPGGKMTFWFQDAAKTETYGEIITIEHPHVFVFSWEHEIARWELFEEGKQKTKLVLTYSKLNTEYAATAPAGLHWMLNELELVLNGDNPDHQFGMEGFTPEQEALMERYAEFMYDDFPELLRYKPIVVEKTYNAPVQRVWQALTDKDKMKQWYFDIPDFKPEVGFEFQFYGQGAKGEQYLHLCKVTEVIPMKKLAHSWSYDGIEGNSDVIFELFPEGQKTRLKLTHRGLGTFPSDKPDFARSSFNQGWTEIIGSLLKKFVEAEGEHLRHR